MTTPTTAPKNGQLIALAIRVAHGEVLKKDYAAMVGVDPTRVSARLNEDFANAIKELQADRNRVQEIATQSKDLASQLQAELKEVQFARNDLQADNATLQAKCSELQAANMALQVEASEAQEKISQLQADKSDLKAGASNMQDEITRLKDLASQLQENATRAQSENMDLQGTVKALQESKTILQATITRLENSITVFTGKPKLIQFFGSPSTRAFLAVLLAFFEMAGSIHLLWPKGALLAIPVGVAMGFSLLAFASSDNEIGKWVCIVFSFAVGIIYFAPWSTGLPGDWLFAFVPPFINATIINSFKKQDV